VKALNNFKHCHFCLVLFRYQVSASLATRCSL